MSFIFSAIGYLHGEIQSKFAAPHQPDESSPVGANGCGSSKIELVPGSSFEAALRDLEGFDRIWLIWCFHKNSSWRPTVLPPRGGAVKRGVFATRSPHRPNPIGITPVTLLSIKGRTLTVGPCDLLDGTPILDIKPYIAKIDSFPKARAGWVDQLEHELSGCPPYQVELSPIAQSQRTWLVENFGIDFIPRCVELLQRDPTPHRTRRIVDLKDGTFRIGCGAWRAYFLVGEAMDHNLVTITRLAPGYPPTSLNRSTGKPVQDRLAQLAFSNHFSALCEEPR